MELVNRTGFPAHVFRQFDRDGALDAIIAMRGTFGIVHRSALLAAAAQEPLHWTDTYAGDPAATPLTGQSDTTPTKPGTDITVLADSYCPDPASPARTWQCGIQITDASGPRLEKLLTVTGPRTWQPRWRERWQAKLGLDAPPVFEGWALSEPEPAQSVPLDWRFARGGALPDQPGAVHPANPIGRGIVGASAGPPCSAPQIEADGQPITDWRSDHDPAGLGPVAPAWQSRLRHTGTADAAWLAHRHPLSPLDFDDRFWQCAPPDQVMIPWLRGTERFVLLNLHPTHPRLAGTLPGIMPGVLVERDGETVARLPMNLDGVHFDLRQDPARVTLTWRARLPMENPKSIRMILTERARLAEAPA